MKINIKEFDLNVDYRQKFKEKCKIDRDAYERKIIDDINLFKMETKTILKEHWDSLFVKPKSIYVCTITYHIIYVLYNYSFLIFKKCILVLKKILQSRQLSN